MKLNIKNAIQDPIDIIAKSINRWNALSWTGCSNAYDHMVNIQWSKDENEPSEANGNKAI